jgi:hypothetical protein
MGKTVIETQILFSISSVTYLEVALGQAKVCMATKMITIHNNRGSYFITTIIILLYITILSNLIVHIIYLK